MAVGHGAEQPAISGVPGQGGVLASHSNPNPIDSATPLTSDTSNRGDYLDKNELEEEESFDKLERSETQKTHEFDPEDEAILRQLASRPSGLQRASTRGSSKLTRQDTIAGLEADDPAFDPNSPSFDLHKYLRMTMKILDEEDIRTKRAGALLKNVTVTGTGSALNLQPTVGSVLMKPFRIRENPLFNHTPSKKILRNFDGIIRSGELLIVLGRPGSGCSTFLKTLTGEMHGLSLDKDSIVHYNGIPQEQMMKEFRGEVVYNQEVDKHFPHLTVGETLEFAAGCRLPQRRAQGISRQDLIKHISQVVMAVYGLSHTYNTKVG